MINPDIKKLEIPISQKDIKSLKILDTIKINGEIITARDKAYSRILQKNKDNEELPLDLQNKVIYHCGPLARKTNNEWKIISAGPTTSSRLDEMQGEFLKITGVNALIGKGGVHQDTVKELRENNCVYLSFPGGAGALAANSIRKVENVIWSDLGMPEAIWVLRVEDFGPLTVAIDLNNGNLYER